MAMAMFQQCVAILVRKRNMAQKVTAKEKTWQ
jgi:hypothetical protein